ncbi:FMN reductase, NADPH-dependent [Vibrio orientalis CIP 102891 = ATCC 33934]|uniref:FMN reductase, NADPH-dependent n=1 Tax=Vibrio orientalis CIP 102891 = ATCC 33934 TaxID=675816 RepID=C9QE63_VIBOR|nr:NAD(P)H-dependent oxidoreductase [Vibrio orientalis]EEX94248.1 hypothetical protein VIA_001406 [Vibrio orientalis CIP 102891 = ATCC 33934]EGU54207.1 FMN reductase, NADPH-dependent [Vibrio orientalis CIP 102891 = ATCC 33934]
MKTLVLFSSANKQGNTAQLVSELFQHHPAEVVDIDELAITPYNYNNDYPTDDFYPLVEKMLAAEHLVFASPVYWHSVTAPMKALIDRMTELLDVAELKPKARQLEGKLGHVVASSASPEICPIYHGFFKNVFKYFNIEMGGTVHAPCKDGFYIEPNDLTAFNLTLNQG